MAKQLIPEELEQLIQEYLTDGVLSDKERAVILKKAEGMGLDRDEVDLYLDAQVQKIDQATDAAVRKQRGKTCPYCGKSVPQLVDKCPHCGEDITAEASEELQEIFENLEDALVNMKSRTNYTKNKAIVERYARKAKMYYGGNPKIQKLLEEVNAEMKRAEMNAVIAETKGTIQYYMKSRWTWFGIEVTLLIVLFIISYNIWRNADGNFASWGAVTNQGVLAFMFLLIPEAIAFIFAIIGTAKWANKGNRAGDDE